MIIQVDETFSIEVSFDPADREEGYLDDIRFRLIESGPKETKIFKADSYSGPQNPDNSLRYALS